MNDAQIPDSADLEALADDAAKRRRKLVAVAVAVPLLVAGGAYGLHHQARATAKSAIEASWNEAAGCLFGGPVGEERASLRARAIQLRVLSSPEVEGKKPWPGTCADPVAALHQALRVHGDAEEPLAKQAEEMAVWLRKVDKAADLSEPFDALAAAARDRGLSFESIPRPAEGTPPEPLVGLTLDNLPASARLAEQQYPVAQIKTTEWRGTELHVMLHDTQLAPDPLVCTFGAEIPKARCRRVRGEVSGKSGLTIHGTAEAGATPLILAGNRGEDGIFRVDGNRVGAQRIGTAHVAADDLVAMIGHDLDPDTGAFDLLQLRPGGALETIRVTPKAAGVPSILRPFVMFGLLVVQSYDRDRQGDPRLAFARLPLSDPPPKLEDGGQLNWVNAPFYACQSKNMIGVRAGSRRGYLAFFDGKTWGTPVFVEHMASPDLLCFGDDALVDGMPPLRCNRAGCEPLDVEVASFEKTPYALRANALLGAKQLSIVVAEERGGVRHAFGSAQPAILLDDLVRDGATQPSSAVLNLRTFELGENALLLLETPRGVFAVYFDAKGQPIPAQVEQL
jgi:hypothetical protein